MMEGEILTEQKKTNVYTEREREVEDDGQGNLPEAEEVKEEWGKMQREKMSFFRERERE